MPEYPVSQPTSAQIQECIDYCLDCSSICLQTFTYCAQMGGRHAAVAHIRRLLDCVDICRATASFMLRGSDLYERVCAVCADVCQQCAHDCERFGDDAKMQACAAICRLCAESCKKWDTTQATA